MGPPALPPTDRPTQTATSDSPALRRVLAQGCSEHSRTPYLKDARFLQVSESGASQHKPSGRWRAPGRSLRLTHRTQSNTCNLYLLSLFLRTSRRTAVPAPRLHQGADQMAAAPHLLDPSDALFSLPPQQHQPGSAHNLLLAAALREGSANSITARRPPPLPPKLPSPSQQADGYWSSSQGLTDLTARLPSQQEIRRDNPLFRPDAPAARPGPAAEPAAPSPSGGGFFLKRQAR